jgi:hypothetical protein
MILTSFPISLLDFGEMGLKWPIAVGQAMPIGAVQSEMCHVLFLQFNYLE